MMTVEANNVNTLSLIENVQIKQVQQTMEKIYQFQSLVQSQLKEGHDYGKIPGAGDKPTLLKPGAEKILMLMGLTSEYEITDSRQDYDNAFFAFTVKCTLLKNGQKITEGFGHANTKEARYSNRWVTEKNLPDGVDKTMLKSRERNGKYGKFKEYLIENDDIFTLVNTVLKMAKKRAQIDATLTVASLSQIFTQDLEDFAPPAADPPEELGKDPGNYPVNMKNYTGPLKGMRREQIEWLATEYKGKDSGLKEAAKVFLAKLDDAELEAAIGGSGAVEQQPA
jgi:hypothetical protein